MRIAVISKLTGKVSNVVESKDLPTDTEKEKFVSSDVADIGDAFALGTFIKPEPVISEDMEALKAERKREAALAEKWPDAFDLIDDILVRGVEVVKADRDAIKEANPKNVEADN